MSSITYKFLRKLRIVSEDSRNKNISFFGAIAKGFVYFRNMLLFKYCYQAVLLEPLNYSKLRAKFWRKIGCHVGEGVCIGHTVSFDYINSDLINIEDHVLITNCCIILAHRRDISKLRKGDWGYQLPYIKEPVTLKKGCQIGMGSIIMPGVTVGEGAVVGARSVVTKDVPAWTVVAGSPAKVIKEIPER